MPLYGQHKKSVPSYGKIMANIQQNETLKFCDTACEFRTGARIHFREKKYFRVSRGTLSKYNVLLICVFNYCSLVDCPNLYRHVFFTPKVWRKAITEL